MLHSFLQWLESTGPAQAISQSDWLFPGIESIHVVAITLVVGSISMVDLRLLGINLRGRPAGELMAEVLPWTWVGFAVAATTGFLLFASSATHYWGTVPFRAKMVLLLLAGLNMAAFHATTYRSVGVWGLEPRGTPAAARLAGGVSLALWIGVVSFGRWIGFV